MDHLSIVQEALAETHTYWVSIGRNVGSEPMNLAEWHAFHKDVRDIVFEVKGTILETVHGRGAWRDGEEESILILATIPGHRVDYVRTILASIASIFHQEAIGFVGGPGTDTYIGSDK